MVEVDLLITNGNVLTLDEKNSCAKSIGCENGRIVGVWDSEQPPSEEVSMTSHAKLIDLKGATIIPGFIDTHNHILDYSLNKNKVDCSSPLNRKIPDILERIKEKAQNTPKEEWIEGYSYDDTALEEQRHPTKKELDQVTPDHPFYMKHITNHFAVANSKALEIAEIPNDIENPTGGKFGRDEDGLLNGVLYEFSAMDFVQSKIPLPTVEEMVDALEIGAKDYLAEGITTNTDAGIGLFYDGEREFHAHLLAAENGASPMRTQLMIMHPLLRHGELFSGYTAEQLNNEIQKRSNGKVLLDSAKLFQDGSIQGYTAALREPYHMAPDIKGDVLHNQEVFNEEVFNLHNRGFRIAIHGNGDRAIGSILTAYENAIEKLPRKNHRHRIEHVQTATADDLDKMQTLNVIGSVFINHVYYWGDRHKRLFLGPERAARIDPLREMVDRNILTTLHSDCPVTPISPLFSVWAAVNRMTSEGETLGEDQKIDVNTALKMMTIYGAEMNGTENETGSIEIGKLADFAILDSDPSQIDSLKIKDIQVQATIIDGKLVYENQEQNV